MKYFFILIILIPLLSFRPLSDIYETSINTIDNNHLDLNQYKGKKMLFIVLPLSGQDTIVAINEITQLQNKYQSSLIVLGIPAEETGFSTSDANQMKMLYKDANIILTEGMKVRKGQQQSALFQWLTNKDKNSHFDQEAEGVGSKFFVDEKGELYAVIGPSVKLAHPIIDKIVSRPLSQ